MKRFCTTFILGALATLAMATAPKIYINPGHGGYNSNDRNIVTIPFASGDTSGFWESRANLIKGLYLRDLLQEAGATVYMSRTDNRSGYRDNTSIATTIGDRPLSTIAREASNKADFMLSIHSNAGNSATSSVNYLLLMLTGTSGSGEGASSFKYSEALTAAKACWPYLLGNELTEWSHYTATTNIKSYTTTTVISPSYLTIPGFLSEGEFHDYHPETHRLLNVDYCKLEAYRFYQFFQAYYSLTKRSTGVVCGDVRDSVVMTNSLYKPVRTGTKDAYTPLNGATVKLYTTSGTLVSTYTTDNYYNGVYVFFDVAPGSYKLEFSANGHQTKVSDITVTASEITTEKVFLSEGTGSESVIPAEPLAAFYDKKLAESSTTWLDKQVVKRALVNGNKIYVLTNDSRIVVVNALTGDSITQLSTSGISSTLTNVSDIALTSDGFLVGCTMESTAYTPTNAWRTYLWSNDDATPTLLFASSEAATAGNFTTSITGLTFCLSGSSTNYKIYTLAETTGGSTRARLVLYNGSTIYNRDDNVKIYIDTIGEDARLTMSPFSENQVFLDSKTIYPTAYNCTWSNGTNFAQGTTFTLTNKALAGGTFCHYGDYTLYVTPTFGEKLGVAIYDVTSGMNAATLVNTLYPSTELQLANVNYVTAAAESYGESDLLVTIFAQGIGAVRWQLSTTEFEEESHESAVTGACIYASELAMNHADNTYTFSCLLNEDATDVEVQLLYEDSIVYKKSFGEQAKGTHAFVVNESDFVWPDYQTDDHLTWAIKATARSTNAVSKLTDDSTPYQLYAAYGVAVDCNSENATFGHIYATNSKSGTCAAGRTTAQGIFAWKADRSAINSTAYAGGISWGADNSPFRLNVAEDGRLFICDFKDAHSGIWIADGANLSNQFTQLFQHSNKLSSGIATAANGDTIHGSISSCYPLGSGQNLQLFTMDEDYLVEGKVGNMLRYDLGTATSWNKRPSSIAYNNGAHKFVVNTTLNLAPDGLGGWWVIQYRYAETIEEPALMHVDKNGTVDFSSGGEQLIDNSRNGGIAISTDYKLLATTNSNSIKIWDINYGEDGAVEGVSLKYTIDENTVSGLGTKSNDLAFDPAGNLYYVSSTTELLIGIGLPKTDNSYTTHAPLSQKIMLPTYSVTFKDFDNTQIVVRNVTHGGAAVAPTEPTRVGYTFAGWDADFSHIYNDTVIRATYTANSGVAYQVKHLQQNIAGTDYILFETENKNGTTDESVTPDVKSYNGFTAPTTQTVTIAADGSTVVEYRYTRNSYTLTWNADGGNLSGTYTSGNVKFGATITIPTVTKEGYTFSSWSPNAPTTMPANNVNVTAIWAAGTNTAYRVLHYQQNLANNDFTLFETENKNGTTGDDVTPDVKSYSGFTAPTTQTITIAADGSTVVEYHYTRNSYTLTWNADGGNLSGEYTSGSIKFGASLIEPSIAKVGYEFSGWNTNVPSTMPATNCTFTATWAAANDTKYIVNHLRQNIEGTQYEQFETETKYGTTGAEVTPNVKTYEGFASPSTQTITIAADGSSVINYQYDRNTYRVRFIIDEHTADSSDLKFGTTIVAPTPAVHEGYIFGGWDADVPATVPAHSLTFTAIWLSGDNTAYKVIHRQQNIADNDYTIFETEYLAGTTNATVTPAVHTYEGFTAPNTQTATILADGSLVITYDYTRNEYSLSWNLNGGSVVEGSYTSGNVKYGTPIVSRPTARQGYIFNGWDIEVPSTMPASDLTFTAQWTPSTNTPYTVYHYLQQLDGTYPTEPSETQVFYGTTNENVKVYSKEYAGFKATSASATIKIAPQGGASHNFNYKRQSYALSWDANGGELAGDYTSGSVLYETPIIAPQATRVGYTFASWNVDVPSSMPSEALTLTAQWTPNTNTTYFAKHYLQNIDGTTPSEPYETITFYGTTAQTVSVATKDYEGFITPAVTNVTIAADGTSVVEYIHTRQSYTLTWDAGEGGQQQKNLLFGENIIVPNAPTLTRYNFLGWGNIAATMPAHDVTYSAQWELKTFVVIFNDINGSQLKRETVEYGATVVAPEAPYILGYTFKNWDKDFSEITENLTIAPIYEIDKYTVTFVTYNNEVKQQVEYGHDAVPPTDCERIGYELNGWLGNYTNVTADVTIYANWKPRNDTRYVVYHYQQNANDNGYTLVDTDLLQGTSDAVVTAALKSYVGFITPEQEQIEIVADGSAEKSYYYDRQIFTVRFMVNDVVYNEQSVRYESAAVAPDAPTHEGYTFVGWDKAFDNVVADLVVTALFEQNTPTAIDATEQTNEIYGLRGRIYINTQHAENVKIYNAAGQLIYQNASNQFTFHCVPGIYLVDIDGQATKVVVP